MHIEEVTIHSSLGVIVPTHIGHTKCSDLVDTGATRSCISEAYYNRLRITNFKHLFNVTVSSASINILQLMGLVACIFTFSQRPYTFGFINCKYYKRPLIHGRYFLKQCRIGTRWSLSRKCILNQDGQVLIWSMGTQIDGPKVLTISDITVPARTWTVVHVQRDHKIGQEGQITSAQSSEADID